MAKASTNIDTQTRIYLGNLDRAKRREKLQTDTDKFERGAGKALFAFGLHTLVDTVEKVAQAIDEFRERQEELIDADVQSMSARANTLRTKLKSK